MVQKTFTIHLAKSGVQANEDLLSSNALTKLADATTKTYDLADFMEQGRLIVFASGRKEPAWFRDLRHAFSLSGNVTNTSSCGLLFFESENRVFAVSFSHGWMYLREENFEGDFGLRTVLNAVDDSKLKRLERANLADAMRGVALSPFQRDFKSFGLDDVLDLVRKISGEAKEESSASILTGSRALKFSGECSIDDLPDTAAECLAYYNSDFYRQTSFGIIDVVSPVTDVSLASTLTEEMIESIKENNDEFELGLPEAPEDEAVAYKFVGPRLRGRYPDLLLRNYISALGENLPDIRFDTLLNHKVAAVYDDASRPDRSWSIRRALVGSIVHDGGRYAINDGEWYRIDEAFKASIETSFQELIEPWGSPPRPLRKQYDDRGNGVYQTEESYNQEVAAEEAYILLDRVLFDIPGVPGSGFELCDLLDLRAKRLIHVKKSSRRSTVLSHFFKQGVNSAQQLKIFPTIWERVSATIMDQRGREAAERLNVLLEETQTKWGVEFRIADAPRISGEFNIPFFSKISLRDEARKLRTMDFNVTVRFIGLQPEAV